MRISRASGRHRPELISLFEAIASARADLPLTGFTPGTIGWAIQSGLGPLLYRAGKDNAHNSTSGLWTDLKAADLTARVIMAEHLEAMCEIIDACDGRLPLTLLKGISIAEEYYPEPHLRLMRDIDILLPKQCFPAVKTVLEQLGYRQEDHPAALYANHHHAAPFFHEEKNVWVEVHHALIAPRRRAPLKSSNRFCAPRAAWPLSVAPAARTSSPPAANWPPAKPPFAKNRLTSLF